MLLPASSEVRNVFELSSHGLEDEQVNIGQQTTSHLYASLQQMLRLQVLFYMSLCYPLVYNMYNIFSNNHLEKAKVVEINWKGARMVFEPPKNFAYIFMLPITQCFEYKSAYQFLSYLSAHIL